MEDISCTLQAVTSLFFPVILRSDNYLIASSDQTNYPLLLDKKRRRDSSQPVNTRFWTALIIFSFHFLRFSHVNFSAYFNSVEM